MLVLSRKVGQQIIVGDGLFKITVVAFRGDKVRIGIEAPPEVRVDRAEIHERRLLEAGKDGKPTLAQLRDEANQRDNYAR